MSELPILESGFTKVPTFFVDELMPFATGIPASFWKFLLILWRDLFGIGSGDGKRGYKALKTMTQFHMSKEVAMQWTAALDVSGFFKVAYGFRFDKKVPGVPTVFQYRPDATLQEWRCFIVALRDQIINDKHEHNKPKGNGVPGFRIALSFTVDAERERYGLPRLWDKWHEELIKKGIIAEDGDGHILCHRETSDTTKLNYEE